MAAAGLRGQAFIRPVFIAGMHAPTACTRGMHACIGRLDAQRGVFDFIDGASALERDGLGLRCVAELHLERERARGLSRRVLQREGA